jgi:putative transposase
VDQGGEVVDVYLQVKRHGAAAKRFFRRLLKRLGEGSRKILTDKLRSNGVAHRELIPETLHSTQVYDNNPAEQAHESTRMRERCMRKIKPNAQLVKLDQRQVLKLMRKSMDDTGRGVTLESRLIST